ncbi:protein disulfide isomerase-like 1-4 [Iris pallida]|uniref:protein disulfide-isomerase n=1 Tax=Iris pallida TaxID=29817 RepID=A0AAX6DG72_IRIPA|nr:protein disulfide isomerase-like 1-4 [Iris pallida]KAJ6790768.1 protein disulfide isomerase-like 1-4 [Iris pallida]KAJ6818811.1 protein disulfide isomerase-like 1-4 [Iris pallida]
MTKKKKKKISASSTTNPPRTTTTTMKEDSIQTSLRATMTTMTERKRSLRRRRSTRRTSSSSPEEISASSCPKRSTSWWSSTHRGAVTARPWRPSTLPRLPSSRRARRTSRSPRSTPPTRTSWQRSTRYRGSPPSSSSLMGSTSRIMPEGLNGSKWTERWKVPQHPQEDGIQFKCCTVTISTASAQRETIKETIISLQFPVDAIVVWIKKKIQPAVQNMTTTEEAEKILTSENKFVLGFLDSLVDTNSQELAAAAQLEDSVTFYQTTTPDVAKFFQIDPKAKRPTLVLVKKDKDNSHFDGQFTKSSILDFVSANKLPLVNIFTKESAPAIFENPIKKQILLFATSKDSEGLLPPLEEAAKLFKGKLIFVYVEMDNEDIGKPVSDYFGVTGNGPNVLGYSGNEDAKKFMLDGELTVDSIKAFAQGFLEDKLKPFYKSDPIPETNEEDVKIVVGNNFDEIVLDESKDVLLEIYAPWCGHCQALEPTYTKLAKHLRSIDSLVIAKMDGTTNEHPRAKSDGFPTILFFPAGNKSFDPITADTDRTVVALYKFIKKNASIPFKLQKPGSSIKSDNAIEADGSVKNEKTDGANVKDEL